MNKQKGITLVSLVVTIIILIILSGISITAIFGENGIITIAKRAKENVEQVQIDEQAELNELYTQMEEENGTVGGISYDAIAKLTEFKKVIAEAITNVGITTDATDSAETMAENIAKIKNNYTYPAKITNDLKAGDYIKYNTGVTTVGENGIITCRVLYEVNSEYGLQIITNENIVSNLTLGGDTFNEGKTIYNNAIETLNNESEKYINTNYVIDARCVGSIPIVDKKGKMVNKNLGTTKTVTLPLNEWTSYTRPSEWTSDDTGCYESDENYIADKTQMESLDIWTIGESYWLASRLVRKDNSGCYFYINRVYAIGASNNDILCDVFSNGNTGGRSSTNGLRSCFSLKSNINIIGGKGTEEEPYTM